MSEEVAKKSSHGGWWILWIVLIVIGVVAAFLGYWMNRPAGPALISVAEAEKSFRSTLNKELEDPQNAYRKIVEKSHLTVDVKRAFVSLCRITPREGKTMLKDEKDIEKIYYEVTTRWDGIIHKDGTTILGCSGSMVDGKLKLSEVKIVQTDALIESKAFLASVGCYLGTLLGLLIFL